MRIVLLDGYIDEPACLGVPPYLSPQARYLAGAILDSGHEPLYLTIDEVRSESPRMELAREATHIFVLAGALVPGKYLRGNPVSMRELAKISGWIDFSIKILGGPLVRYGELDADIIKGFDAVVRNDLDAFAYDLLSNSATTGKPNAVAADVADCEINNVINNAANTITDSVINSATTNVITKMRNISVTDRRRTPAERDNWAVSGAVVANQHPDHPQPLICELELYQGCVRYHTGGCSFCTEPGYGKPHFREPAAVASEVEALAANGVTNFRLGAQSCIFSYKAIGIGATQTPTPCPDAVQLLLEGIRKAAPDLQVLHLDNANPAIMAEHPEETRRILKIIAQNCTGGNVLSLGMESADPAVIEANNLNATPDQVMAAIRMVNEVGREIGNTGLPKLLPGINILSGLDGETKNTNQLNLEFLRSVMEDDLLLRRINIRQVAPFRRKFRGGCKNSGFRFFKEQVRTLIDTPMLAMVAPPGTLLKDVFTEIHKGKLTFGRQIGTYPLLVGIPYPVELERFVDVRVTSNGPRSLTGVVIPVCINTASLAELRALPGIGAKRAATLISNRPFATISDALEVLGSGDWNSILEVFLKV